MKNVAGSGGKWLDVSADRLPGWIASFAVRHGVSDAQAGSGEALTVAVGDDHVSFTAQDGAVAQCYPPFPPAGGVDRAARGGHAAVSAAMTPTSSTTRPGPDSASQRGPDDPAAIAEALAAHARKPRTVGVLLVRLGGYAAGVFTGYPPVLGDAKVGSRLVHGRSAAGGWSQHRFARRREKQANEALSAAADAAVLIFGRRGATVRSTSQKRATTGGAAADGRPQPGRPAWTPLFSAGTAARSPTCATTPGSAPYFALATERFLTVPDPKRAVLLEAAKQFTAVRIWLTEP